ncbi:MAG TPA: hypothetical protein VMF64_12090 [Steroidobacteraceae bacterium]|nr:hypothetical protein [Steroidobacteraceae bacterium]
MATNNSTAPGPRGRHIRQAAARDAAHRAFSTAFRRAFETEARDNPNGHSGHTVERFLAAMREELEARELAWRRQHPQAVRS